MNKNLGMGLERAGYRDHFASKSFKCSEKEARYTCCLVFAGAENPTTGPKVAGRNWGGVGLGVISELGSI